MSPFEKWWQSQGRLVNVDDRSKARTGWDWAFEKTIYQLTADQEEGFDERQFILRGTMPFDLGHNGAVKYMVEQLRSGIYPNG